jgi:aminoglycoside phosphotransferase family enzyme/predicted kinase
MELAHLLEALSDPSAYAHPVDAVEIRQTHISVVFLAGPYAYKIKKPLILGFLDYSTLERRRHFCEREASLNRRLAPSVYLGVVPVVQHGSEVKMDSPGEAIEWAVKMTRLPDENTLRERLRRDEVGAELVEYLATRVASFHARVEAGPHISAAGRFGVVARNARENFDQSASQVGTALDRAVFERLRTLTEQALDRNRILIEARADRGVPLDTHGDLRLGHVYFFPERGPPEDLVIVDCIEFDDRYRHADPVADMAFLALDFSRYNRRDLGRVFADSYFRASGDAEGRTLLSFYAAYRAAVRGKVEGLKHLEPEIPANDRAIALAKARAFWLLALGELEAPGRRPCLVLVGGLPGAGKSTLARALADRAGFAVIRSDLVRKELVARVGEEPVAAPYGEGIYSPEWNERTYIECSRRAEGLLFEGGRVVVDASFARDADRRFFSELAARSGVPTVFLLCQVEPAVARARLEGRRHDASDADWSVHREAARHWEEPGPVMHRFTREVATGGDLEDAFSRAITILRELELED